MLNVNFTDVKAQFVLETVNGVLNHTPGRQAKDADATLTLSRETLNRVVLKQATLKDAIAAGDVKISGTEAKLDEMLSYLDGFDFWFNIVTP